MHAATRPPRVGGARTEFGRVLCPTTAARHERHVPYVRDRAGGRSHAPAIDERGGVGWGVARLRRCRAPRVPATPHHVGRFFRSAWAAIASRLKSFPLSPRERLARTTTVASAGTTNSDGATAHTTARRLAAVATLVVCARLRIILIYSITSAASPSAPANTHARRRGFSPGYPCRDADARPNPTQAPAGLLHKFRAGCQTVVFSFHRSHRFPAIESHRPSPPLSRPARQSRVSWQLRCRPLVACLSASRRLRPFPGFFFPTQGECRIYSSARTILAPVFPVLTRICAPSPWMHLL